jgi:hypothetical protein
MNNTTTFSSVSVQFPNHRYELTGHQSFFPTGTRRSWCSNQLWKQCSILIINKFLADDQITVSVSSSASLRSKITNSEAINDLGLRTQMKAARLSG